MSSMDLDTAYEIAGGYIEADEKTFEEALKMVREHDAELAEMLETAHKEELLAKHKQQKSEEFAMLVDGKTLEENTSFLYNELENAYIEEELLKASQNVAMRAYQKAQNQNANNGNGGPINPDDIVDPE